MKSKKLKTQENLQRKYTKKIGGNIIRAVDLTKKYRNEFLEFETLSKVNLNIRLGEVLAIVGPSGCGKTTLLNCLSGLDDLNGGIVYFNEKSLSEMSDQEKSSLRGIDMGFIFQNFNLIPVLTAKENVELALLPSNNKLKNTGKIAELVLEQIGLKQKLNYKPNQLSGGEKQRVAIARAIVHKPKIVWADEPTGSLDSKTSEEVINLILKLNKELGITFVIVTHDLKIAALADRIIRMDSGKVI